MTDKFWFKIINLCVAKLSNSQAIAGVSRLDLDHFKLKLHSPRLIQRFLNYIVAPELKTGDAGAGDSDPVV